MGRRGLQTFWICQTSTTCRKYHSINIHSVPFWYAFTFFWRKIKQWQGQYLYFFILFLSSFSSLSVGVLFSLYHRSYLVATQTITSSDRLTVNKDLEIRWNWAIVAQFKVLQMYLPGGTSKITEDSVFQIEIRIGHTKRRTEILP